MLLAFLELGINFGTQFLQGAKGAKLPLEVINAVQAMIDALINHKQDVINKANLEAGRA